MSGWRWTRGAGGRFIVKHYGKDWGMSLLKNSIATSLLAEFSGSFYFAEVPSKLWKHRAKFVKNIFKF